MSRSFALDKVIIIMKTIFPVFLCILFLTLFLTLEYFQYYNTYYAISLFGVIVILLNFKKIKYPFVISLVLSQCICYFVFFSSVIFGKGIYYIFKNIMLFFGQGIENNNNFFSNSDNIINVAIVAPFLLIYLHSFLFRLKRNSFFYKIILGAIIILVSLGFSKMLFGDNRRLFIIWQSVVMLGLQLILYNKELRMKFITKA